MDINGLGDNPILLPFEGLTWISRFKLPPTCKTRDESPVNVWYVALVENAS